MVFDIPNHKGTYAERFNELGMYTYDMMASIYTKTEKHFADTSCKYIEMARKEECRDVHHMETFFQEIIDRGGEGIILRDPRASYQPGRSPGYLKHKVSSLTRSNINNSC